MNPYSLAILCFSVCSFFVGLLIFLKRSDSIGKTYFVFTLLNSLWALFFGICWVYNDSSEKAVFFIRLSDTCAIFIPPTWFHFSLVYAEEVKKYKRLLIGSYGLALCLSLFGMSNFFIPSLKTTSLGLVFVIPGLAFYIFTGFFSVFILIGFFFLIKKMYRAASSEKGQIFGFIVATALGFIGGGFTLFPVHGVDVPQYGIFLMPFYPFLTAFFMMKKGLFDVEELAQAAHRDKLTAIGVLAASINHEVRNPLFIIKGLAESCLERQKEGIFSSKEKALESANDAMKRSMEQADRAMDIIKRLSLFAKAGIEGEMKFEAVNVQAVLEDILPLVRYELATHSIALIRDIPKDLPEVQADRRYLEEIFFNLIVNAIQALKDANKPGEIKINATSKTSVIPAKAGIQGLDSRLVHSGMTEKGAGQVIITISDNGPGIPTDKLKEVFRPFYTTKAEGTGLGLYITKQLVEKIRGRIDVHSEVGRGTTFTVTLAS
jgi:signal transduction histidine kinase